MSYSFQSFASGQIFTAAQANQIEESIASHRHGILSVGISGLSWAVGSLETGVTITQRDNLKNYAVTENITIGFNPVAVLGSTFGVGFTNIGSGRVVLAAAAGEFIGPSSQFVLTPGSNISVHGGATQLSLFGHTTGEFLLFADEQVGSKAVTQTIPFPWMCDFNAFRFKIGPTLVTSAATNPVPAILLQWSVDSGSSFIETGYELCGGGNPADPAVYSNVESGAYFAAPIAATAVTSGPLLYDVEGSFYRASAGSAFMIVHNTRTYVRSNGNEFQNRDFMTIFGASSPGIIQANSVNAFKILGSSNAYTEQRDITIWGVR